MICSTCFGFQHNLKIILEKLPEIHKQDVRHKRPLHGDAVWWREATCSYSQRVKHMQHCSIKKCTCHTVRHSLKVLMHHFILTGCTQLGKDHFESSLHDTTKCFCRVLQPYRLFCSWAHIMMKRYFHIYKNRAWTEGPRRLLCCL